MDLGNWFRQLVLTISKYGVRTCRAKGIATRHVPLCLPGAARANKRQVPTSSANPVTQRDPPVVVALNPRESLTTAENLDSVAPRRCYQVTALAIIRPKIRRFEKKRNPSFLSFRTPFLEKKIIELPLGKSRDFSLFPFRRDMLPRGAKTSEISLPASSDLRVDSSSCNFPLILA